MIIAMKLALEIAQGIKVLELHTPQLASPDRNSKPRSNQKHEKSRPRLTNWNIIVEFKEYIFQKKLGKLADETSPIQLKEKGRIFNKPKKKKKKRNCWTREKCSNSKFIAWKWHLYLVISNLTTAGDCSTPITQYTPSVCVKCLREY